MTTEQEADDKFSDTSPPPSAVAPAPRVSLTSPPPVRGGEAPPAIVKRSGQGVTERFESANATKLGIVGGKGSGKSYLFQSMVYKTADPARAGALSYYLGDDTPDVFHKEPDAEEPVHLDTMTLVDQYKRWIELETTTLLNHRWYKLRIRYRRGFFRLRTDLDVQFFDGSGDAYQAEKLTPDVKELWKRAFLDARVMVFCLPMWAAFPASRDLLTPADHEMRHRLVDGFRSVVRNFVDVRAEGRRRHTVRSVLALTMADDRRSALTALRDRWVTPFMRNPNRYARALRTGSGVARYLADARAVSEALRDEFDHSPDRNVSSIPRLLDFGDGWPWIVPVSAIEGTVLEDLERARKANEPAVVDHYPEPVHVELPLLVALCERHNALM
jgi:hypothetical protein